MKAAVFKRTPAFLTGCVILLCSAAMTASGQAEEVFTLAGTGTKGYAGDGGPAASAQLNNVYGLGRGPDGLLYICDMDNDCVRRILADGSIETYAGNGTKGYSGDGGPAAQATLRSPYEVAWDKAGNLYFVELANHCVRKVDAKTRVISTVAGTGKPGFGGDDGPATNAQLNQPHSLTFDADGRLYVCDILNHRIRRIDLQSGVITTWAGTGEKKTAPDGARFTGSPLHGPRAITFAADGTCWLALREGNAVLTLDPVSGTLKRVAGTGKSGFTGNGGPALQATLSGPKGISLGPDGNVYLADTESHSIRYIDVKKGTVELLVGNGKKGDGPDGTSPKDCQLARPHGVFVDKDGTVYIGDSENHRVRVWKK